MTAREMYEYALIELNKLEAPSLLLEDYNYFINKAVQQYINLIYNKLELDQQSVDDLRVLKASTILTPHKMGTDTNVSSIVANTLLGNSYYADLPYDYLHLYNCVVEYNVAKNFKCYDKDTKVYFAARRLNSDMYSQILNNAYLRPTYRRPYYYLNNINHYDGGPYPVRQDPTPDSEDGTDPTINTSGNVNDIYKNTNTGKFFRCIAKTNVAAAGSSPSYEYTWVELRGPVTATNNTIDSTILNYNKGEHSDENITVDTQAPSGDNYVGNDYLSSNLVDSVNTAGDRLANPSIVRLELRFGRDDSIFTPTKIYVDYIKAPMYIRLTQEQIDSTLDHSQALEFPDYVCFEIVNIFTRLLMENASDPRLQTNMPINNTIANPTLQQQQATQQTK